MSFIVKRHLFFKLVRVSLVALFGIALSSIAKTENAEAADALYSAIRVDIEPIKGTGLGDLANPIGAAVKRSLAKTYAGLIDTKSKSLPILIVEVETIYYGNEQDTFISHMARHFTHTLDQMTGTAIVRKGNRDLKRVSVLGNNTTQGGWPLMDDVKSGRLQALTDRFADAVHDELGD